MIDPKMPSDEAIQQIARQAGMTPEAVRKNYETVFGASTPVESEKLALDALVSMVRGATERAPEAVLSKVDLILGALGGHPWSRGHIPGPQHSAAHRSHNTRSSDHRRRKVMTHNVVVTIGKPTRDGLTARLVCHAPLGADCGPYRKPEHVGQCSLTDMFSDIAVEAMEEYSGDPLTLIDRPVKLIAVNEDTFDWQFAQIECPHWEPGKITLRSGCTACQSQVVEAVEREL